MNDGDPKILPPNAFPIERAIDAAGEARLRLLKVQIRHLWNAVTCPTTWLPVLAWALGVDTWRSDWPESTKRAVIAATPTVKRLKGTVGAVRRAVQAVAGAAPVKIVEWFKPDGSGVPLTARVEIDVTAGASPRLIHDANNAANTAKRESVHLDLRLVARPETHIVAASRLRPPVVHALSGGDARYAPRLSSRVQSAAHIRKPITLGRVNMDGAIVRPMAGGCRTAALMSKSLIVARLVLDGGPIRPFTSGLRTAANIRTPAVVARVAASGA